MDIKEKKIILYGLKNKKEIIDKIILELGILCNEFDIRLILTEALINAFIHGNDSDKSGPIYLSYYYDDKSITFKIKDSGNKLESLNIADEISDENLLDDHGRGLFLIKCLADELKYEDNTLVIIKNIEKRG